MYRKDKTHPAAMILSRVTIGPPAKRYSDRRFRWRADSGPILLAYWDWSCSLLVYKANGILYFQCTCMTAIINLTVNTNSLHGYWFLLRILSFTMFPDRWYCPASQE